MGLVKPKNLSRLFIFDTVDFRIRIHNLIQRIKFEKSRSATQKPPGRHKNKSPVRRSQPASKLHRPPSTKFYALFLLPGTEISRRCSD
ncbi:hypothetical protein ACFX13_016606 [Malus domestica]